jgi:hypothetical protein
MGYYTRYEFVSAEGGDAQAIKECIETVSDYGNLFDDSCKWYDHEKDMSEVSKRFPNVLIRIDGEGEEAGDVWRLAAKNGRVEKIAAELVFKDFTIN